MFMIKIKHLDVSINDKSILKDLNLDFDISEKKLLMGPNGSGKSTLARVILGDREVEVDNGKVMLTEKSDTIDIIGLSPAERAEKGIFVGFQHPVTIPGVSFSEMLFFSYRKLFKLRSNRSPGEGTVREDNTAEQSGGDEGIANENNGNDDDVDGEKIVGEGEVRLEGELEGFYDYGEFYDRLVKKCEYLGIEKRFLSRNVNEGLSGGEKKKMELLQMIILRPRYVILDEPDSGMDADSIGMVSKAVAAIEDEAAILIISHNAVNLDIQGFDEVLIMKEGGIAKRGDKELIQIVDEKGYEEF